MTGIVHIYASQRVVGMRTIRYKVEHAGIYDSAHLIFHGPSGCAGIYDSAHLIFHGPSVRRKIGVSYYSKI